LLGSGLILRRCAFVAASLLVLALTLRALPAGAQGNGFECVDGQAGPYPCENMDLAATLTLPELGSVSGNDVWGWTDPATDRQYAIVGTMTATGFVDVTEPTSPIFLGKLPRAGLGDSLYWSDIKTNGHHAFIVSEGTESGMQVFDLHRLRGLDGTPVPELFDADAHYDGTSNTHNIWINEETDFAYLVGSDTCTSENGPESEDGGLHMVDISDPLEPSFAGCALVPVDGDDDTPANNYVHDVECIVYDGPDGDYTGQEICIGMNEDAIVVYDVTDKQAPVIVSETSYPTASYTHQGSLTPDRRYVLFGDELDELQGAVANTTTYIADVSDLDSPGEPRPWSHETESIDHNLYVRGDHVYQSNYAAGQRILRYDNEMLADGELDEVAYLDTMPGVDVPEFLGVWSNYLFEDTGTLVVSGTESNVNGLFVMLPKLGSGSEGAGDEVPGGDNPSGPDEGGPSGPSCRGMEATIVGTAGPDELVGTKGPDVIVAGAGADRIRGRGGDDVICAGKGADDVRGGKGADRSYGGRGADRIRGGGDDDLIVGGRGGDRLRGGGGEDELRGGSGRDRIHGGAGDDELRGGRGADRLNGGPGDDRCRGGRGRDRLRSCER
jgi:choice-of-anchor B domain-containing protein